MTDYQDLIAEKRELDDKHSKLAEFIGGAVYLTLCEDDRDLLLVQLDLMKSYSDVLGQRIARWLG